MIRVLVTGASGFVGSSLTARLRASNYHVVGMTRDIRLARENDRTCVDEWVECNLGDPTANYQTVMENIDFVFHLAANAHQSKQTPYEDYHNLNTVATEKLAKSAAASSVKKFIYLSTIKVNGDFTDSDKNEAFTELSNANPEGFYALSKLEAEKCLTRVCQSSKMSYVILRPPLVYGVGVKANFLSLMRIIKLNIPLPFGTIRNRRSFIYVDNLAEILERCINNEKANNQLYLLKDVTVSLPALIKAISRALGSGTYLFYCPVALLSIAATLLKKKSTLSKLISSLEIDDSKIRHDLDWEPAISFDESIAETADWFVRRNSVSGN